MLFSSGDKPIKVYAVIAYTEECSFIARVYKHKCEAKLFCRMGDGNPHITTYTIEEVMLY